MTDYSGSPERIMAWPDRQHGWLHGLCSSVLSEAGAVEYIRADALEAQAAEIERLREALGKLRLQWRVRDLTESDFRAALREGGE